MAVRPSVGSIEIVCWTFAVVLDLITNRFKELSLGSVRAPGYTPNVLPSPYLCVSVLLYSLEHTLVCPFPFFINHTLFFPAFHQQEGSIIAF